MKSIKKKGIILGVGALVVTSLGIGGFVLTNQRQNTQAVAVSTELSDAVKWANDNGYMNGYANTISRGEVASVLWKYLNEPRDESCTSKFKDIRNAKNLVYRIS